jgi:hypothetical protein
VSLHLAQYSEQKVMQHTLEPVLIEIIHFDQIAFLPLHNIFLKCGSFKSISTNEEKEITWCLSKVQFHKGI